MRTRLALVLVVLAAVLTFAGLAANPMGEGRSPEEHFGAWKAAMESTEDSNPADAAKPFTYYADDFGAYFYDGKGNRIYAAAAFESDNWTAVEGKGTGGGGSVGCWQFTFLRNGYYFPNPGDSYTNFKASMNLLVLGTDFQFYNATLSSRVSNTLGQTVYSKTLGSYVSSPSFVATVWNGKNNSGSPVASGVYNIRVTASSSICGSKSFNGLVTIIN